MKKTLLLLVVGFAVNAFAKDEAKREPAAIDGVTVQTLTSKETTDNNYYSRIIDTKLKIVCYSIVQISSAGGTSISCLKYSEPASK